MTQANLEKAQTCKACGTGIPDGGLFCPHCGNRQVRRPPSQPINGRDKKRSDLARAVQWVLWSALAILGLSVGLFFVALAVHPAPSTSAQTSLTDPPAPSPSGLAQQKADWRTQSIAFGEARVRKALRDPESANFQDVIVIDQDQFDPKSPGALCGEVNSKNGFGGYVGFQRFVVLAGTPLLENSSPDFKSAWHALCSKR